MGTKARNFLPLPKKDLSLEELVPEDHFYRRLEARLDLSFVRELVRPLYAHAGRPSVDPVVFFKLQLVMFFEDLRSERRLMRVVADRLSLRWYLGYDLRESLPDHSSLTKIRERYGLEVFRGFFDRIVEMRVEAEQWHGMGRVNGEVLVAASGQNAERLLGFWPRKPRGMARAAAPRPRRTAPTPLAPAWCGSTKGFSTGCPG